MEALIARAADAPQTSTLAAASPAAAPRLARARVKAPAAPPASVDRSPEEPADRRQKHEQLLAEVRRRALALLAASPARGFTAEEVTAAIKLPEARPDAVDDELIRMTDAGTIDARITAGRWRYCAAAARPPACRPDGPGGLAELLQLLEQAEDAAGHRNPVDRAVCLALSLATGRRVPCGHRLGDALRAHVSSWARRAEEEREAKKTGRAIMVDEQTINLGRLGLAEGKRTGTLPRGYTLEQLLADGAYERGALLAYAALGFDLRDMILITSEPARVDDAGHVLVLTH